MTDKIVVFSSCSSQEEADRVARHLVEQRLAACVTTVPGASSTYWWQGQVEQSAEIVLIIKSSRPRFPKLQEELRRIHSYQVPEVIALPIADGAQDYLDWLGRELEKDR
ncbi:MAG: divalent-cation tolerance protein CutA [Acidobacteria bacterium]|nr:divalent-cation tolerance protein CutA [Acidobacteriota bacterium]